MDVASEAKRAALAALLAIPCPRDPFKKARTLHLAVVISVAAARPHLSPISRRRRGAIFELGHADPTDPGGEDGLLLAHLPVRLPPASGRTPS